MAPSYFKEKYVPIITYSSTTLTARNICNYTAVDVLVGFVLLDL
jgi:hypothetical protein